MHSGLILYMGNIWQGKILANHAGKSYWQCKNLANKQQSVYMQYMFSVYL